MKSTLISFAVFLITVSNTVAAQKTEEAAIIQLLQDESHFAAKGDSVQWANCWLNSEDVSFIHTTAEGVQTFHGYKSLAQAISSIEPFELKLKRDNYRFTIGKDIAFVSFDQQDNWGGVDQKKKETRTLRKVSGKWKTVHSSVVVISSFEQPQTASYHMLANQLPKHPGNGFTNISGLGGMSIGYMEVPGPADFTPFFKGLPDDMCASPHWGYVLEGSLKLKYPGGKEETVNAGEVFYWPAPHTGVVEKNVKFIDFSPDGKFKIVMDHISKKMKEMQGK